MLKEQFYIREVLYTKDPTEFLDRFHIHRVIENFINLNNISKEGLHSIKHERDRIDLFFHHQGKLNVDFGDAIIKTHLLIKSRFKFFCH